MSLFRLVKYSSLIYFLGRHRSKLFRSAAVLLFAFITSLIYDDLRHYLEIQHPGSLLYALIAKIVIVYGSLAFVLWQFRPRASAPGAANREKPVETIAEAPADGPLDALRDIDQHDHLRTRYERILDGQAHARTSEADGRQGENTRKSSDP